MLVKQTPNKGYLCTLDPASEEDSKFLENLKVTVENFNLARFYTRLSARIKTMTQAELNQKDVYLFYYKEGNLL